MSGCLLAARTAKALAEEKARKLTSLSEPQSPVTQASHSKEDVADCTSVNASPASESRQQDWNAEFMDIQNRWQRAQKLPPHILGKVEAQLKDKLVEAKEVLARADRIVQAIDESGFV